jgi:hypothetical protein
MRPRWNFKGENADDLQKMQLGYQADQRERLVRNEVFFYGQRTHSKQCSGC